MSESAAELSSEALPGVAAAAALRKRRRWRRWLWGLVGLASVPAVLWLAFWCAVGWWPYAAVRASPAGIWVEDRNGAALAAFVGRDEQWRIPLRYEEISPRLLQAIVAVEDRRFYAHGGVDWWAGLGAAWQDGTSLKIARGASTITMQVARLRDPESRSWGYKIEQAVRACQIERTMTKGEILTEYVNRAPFGGNLVGAGAASWRYFGKACGDLSLGQAALLAGLPQSPNRLRPDRFAALAGQRRETVLRRMRACGFISEAEMREAEAEPVNAMWRALPQAENEAAQEGSLPALNWIGEHGTGRVRTTLDAGLQRQVGAALRDHLAGLAASGITAGVVVLLDNQTSELLASASISGEAGQLDLARCARSSGSTLKPFIYAAAFEAGQTAPEWLVDDSPRAWAGYVPGNSDRQFHGSMTAGDALAESRNIPAMTLVAQMGVERALGTMESVGLSTLRRPADQYGLSLAIGGGEVTPLQLAGAYATLARGGMRRGICWQRDDGANEETVRVLAEAACWQTLGALDSPARTADVWPDAVRTHVAWKTGTSSGCRDAWCAAVTRRHTIVVWLGNSHGEGAAGLSGAQAAAPLALKLMAALDGVNEPWPVDTETRKEMNETSSAATQSRARLSIVTPAPRQQVLLNLDEPAERQRLALHARGGAGDYWWFVDDNVVGEGKGEEIVWWPPVSGEHDIRVVDAEGRGAAVRVSVR